MPRIVSGLAFVGLVALTGVDHWYIPLREGCQGASTSGLSPKAVMAAAIRDGYEYQVIDSGGERPDVIMVKSDHPLFGPTGGGMLFARSLATCERLRSFGAVRDALEDERYE